MPAFGSNAKLSITKQNSFDGDYTAPGSWHKVPFANHDLNFMFGELTDDSILARYDEPDRNTGISGVEGNIIANFTVCFGVFSKRVLRHLLRYLGYQRENTRFQPADDHI